MNSTTDSFIHNVTPSFWASPWLKWPKPDVLVTLDEIEDTHLHLQTHD